VAQEVAVRVKILKGTRRKRAVDDAGSGENATRPYRQLALIYDELVGDSAFDCWRENFDRLVARYSIEYEAAADIACGTGHAVAYLISRCDRVYGVDISPEMLQVASFRVRAQGSTFIEQSFTDFELPEKVDLLTCNFDSLNYLLSAEDVAEALRRFADSLKPGGYCIFDMNTTRELELEWGTSVLVHRVNNGFAVWESEWDPQLRINSLRMTNFILREDGLYERSEEMHRERSYDLDFLIDGLRDAGFSHVEAYDAKGLAVVNEDTRRVHFLARR